MPLLEQPRGIGAAVLSSETLLAEFCVDVQRGVHAFATTTTGLAGFDLPTRS